MGRTWGIQYSFQKGQIRHVHGLFHDPYRDGCWVLTGDTDEECKILFSPDRFHTLEVVTQGSQRVRAATMIPLEEGIILPMDSPLEDNYIQHFVPETGKIDKIRPIPGSCFCSTRAGEYYLISTAVEPRKKNKQRVASIWFSKNGFDWKELYSQEKDIWPKYFQHGILWLTTGLNGRPTAFAYGQAVKKDDGYLLKWNLDQCWKESSKYCEKSSIPESG
jgi:hypothetical protein